MVDNTLWDGEVLDEKSQDKIVKTLRGVNDALAASPRWHSVILPIGDGLTVAVKC